jgi:hypothetical protein
MLKEDNLVRDQSWVIQIHHFELNCTSRTMQRACKRHRSKAERYKMTKIKLISSENKKLRKEYDLRHQTKTIESFWQYIHFTDKAHFDSNETYSKRVLHEEVTQYEASNMQIMSDLKDVKLYFVASIFWHHKSPLQFYSDEHDSSFVIIKKSLKSRR